MSEAIKAAVEFIDGYLRRQGDYDQGGEVAPAIAEALRILRPVASGRSVIVPVEPTEEMKTIADDVLNATYSDEQHKIEAGFVWAKIHRAVIRAMIQASNTEAKED